MLDDNDPDTGPNTSTLQPNPNQEMPQEPPPPAGDSEKADKYLRQLIELVNQDKLPVYHTDLKKFDINSIQDHYRMDFNEYEVEVSHSKQPDTGQDFYILLFNNIKKIETAGESCVNKVILAYTHLTEVQFEDFKEAAEALFERKRKKEEAKRFAGAMAPIDKILSDLSSTLSEEASSAPAEQNTDLADFTDKSDEPKASDFQNQPQTAI